MTASHISLFNLAVYLYDEGYYDSFKARTEEKVLTGMVQGFCNSALVKQGLVFHQAESRIFDMGSGPCDTSLLYYLSTGFKCAKVTVRAVDENAQYVGGQDLATREHTTYLKSDAYRNFQVAQKEFNARGIELDFRSSQGDAFNGQSVANVSVENDVTPNSFDMAFLSHLFYHVAPKDGLSSEQRLDNALNDVARNILKKEGIAVAYHVAIGEKDDNYSFQYFRDNFGSKSSSVALHSNTDAMDTKDPATKIERSCVKQGITCRTLRVNTKLHFSDELFDDTGKIKNDVKAIFKNPDRYQELLKTPELYQDLKSIYFIVQRSANEMSADKSETGLDNLMEKILDVIQDTSDEYGHHLIMHEKMQLITNPERPIEIQEKVDAVLQEVESQMGILYEAAAKKFFERGQHQGLINQAETSAKVVRSAIAE
jgi:hypothetical protein